MIGKILEYWTKIVLFLWVNDCMSDKPLLNAPSLEHPIKRGSVPVLRFAELDSTNKYARRIAESGQFRGREAVIVAEQQTAGVGRFRRAWASPAGGLWCTFVFPLPHGADGDKQLDGLGLRVGIACTRTIASILNNTKRPCDVRLKWPNDVLINGRKACGVLCELVTERSSLAGTRYVLVGVGVNANMASSQLPPELREKATGLLDHLPHTIDLDALLACLHIELMTLVGARGLSPELLEEARQRLYGIGQPAAVSLSHGHKVHGTLLGIDTHGLALLRTDDGVFTAPGGTVLVMDSDGDGVADRGG